MPRAQRHAPVGLPILNCNSKAPRILEIDTNRANGTHACAPEHQEASTTAQTLSTDVHRRHAHNNNTDKDTDRQMSFSQWMSELHEQERHQLRCGSNASPVSMGSSWAETDSDSDSECEFGFADFGATMACKSKKADYLRSAPILIPNSTRKARTTAHHVDECSSDEKRFDVPAHQHVDIDDEDLLLFGNLAYFQTQHRAVGSARQRSTSPLSSTHASDEDGEIFSMEL